MKPPKIEPVVEFDDEVRTALYTLIAEVVNRRVDALNFKFGDVYSDDLYLGEFEIVVQRLER